MLRSETRRMIAKAFVPLFFFGSALLLGACTQPPDPTNPAKPAQPIEIPKVSPAMSDAQELAPTASLEAGHVTFQGMVRPTKGGYEVHGAIVEDDLLPNALAHARSAEAKNSEWFLGAIVRITGIVRKHEAPSKSDDGIVMQMRSGSWFEVERIESASVVKPAEMLEGTLQRSKGFFAVGGRLVSSEDVAWSLGPQGGKEGDKVRFYGQSRTVVCEPNAQCLIEGSLPLFDVGRAERLP